MHLTYIYVYNLTFIDVSCYFTKREIWETNESGCYECNHESFSRRRKFVGRRIHFYCVFFFAFHWFAQTTNVCRHIISRKMFTAGGKSVSHFCSLSFWSRLSFSQTHTLDVWKKRSNLKPKTLYFFLHRCFCSRAALELWKMLESVVIVELRKKIENERRKILARRFQMKIYTPWALSMYLCKSVLFLTLLQLFQCHESVCEEKTWKINYRIKKI